MWFDGAIERELGGVTLAIRGTEVEVDVMGLKRNPCGILVNLFEIKRGDDRGAGLVEVVSTELLALPSSKTGLEPAPHSVHFFLPTLLPSTYKQMPVLGLAALDVHELVKLQDAPLAATPPLAPLVEYRRARMVHAALSGPVSAFELDPARPSPASHALLDL